MEPEQGLSIFVGEEGQPVQFFLIRRVIELLLLKAAVEPFRDCVNLHDVWVKAFNLDELKFIGVACCILVVITGLVEMAQLGARQIMRLYGWLIARLPALIQPISKLAAPIAGSARTLFARFQNLATVGNAISPPRQQQVTVSQEYKSVGTDSQSS
jgi:hypothetical protein